MHLSFRIIILLNIFLSTVNGYSQGDSIQNSTLGIHLSLGDYLSGSVFKTYFNPEIKQTYPGFALSFTKGLTKYFDWNIMAHGSFADSILKKRPPYGKEDLYADVNFAIRAKMFSAVKRVNPFLHAGIGISQYKQYTGVFIHAGAGVQVNVFGDIYLVLQTKYNIPIGSVFRGHYTHSLGIAGIIGKPRRKVPPTIPKASVNTMVPEFDQDHDAIADSVDSCPVVAGLAEFKGCPDRDKDGVEDKLDHCPDVFGKKEYQGCPIPDTDQDGILDNADECIDIPGVLQFRGCPVPDRDNDGVIDPEDNCPDVPGPVANKGCPLITQDLEQKVTSAARNIFFASGKASLLRESFYALDEVVTILKADADLTLKIEGHTDNLGDSIDNQLLSEARANAVFKYISDKGISKDRLHAVGYGESRPVVQNNSPKGKVTNRRVEFRLSY